MQQKKKQQNVKENGMMGFVILVSSKIKFVTDGLLGISKNILRSLARYYL
jgi:hypothetical protein